MLFGLAPFIYIILYAMNSKSRSTKGYKQVFYFLYVYLFITNNKGGFFPVLPPIPFGIFKFWYVQGLLKLLKWIKKYLNFLNIVMIT